MCSSIIQPWNNLLPDDDALKSQAGMRPACPVNNKLKEGDNSAWKAGRKGNLRSIACVLVSTFPFSHDALKDILYLFHHICVFMDELSHIPRRPPGPSIPNIQPAAAPFSPGSGGIQGSHCITLYSIQGSH